MTATFPAPHGRHAGDPRFMDTIDVPTRHSALLGWVLRRTRPEPAWQGGLLTWGGKPPQAEDPISVVVPHWGDPALAGRLVDDLLDSQDASRLQIVVVDDASPTSFDPREGVTVVRRDSNGGFGAAVNTGARLASHPWLMILNSDLRLTPGWIAAFVNAASSVQPAVCSPQLMESGSPAPTANLFHANSWKVVLLRSHLFTRLRVDHSLARHLGHDTTCRPGKRRQTDWLTGACLLMPRLAFEGVGGFDERFHMFSEEVDLQLRLAQLGVAAWFLGDLTVDHVGGGSTDPEGRAQALLRSQFVFARKWGFARRLLAAFGALAVVNLGYDIARDVTGRRVGAFAWFRRRLRMARVAWRDSGDAMSPRDPLD